MTKQIYQIMIELKNSKPKIWRRVLVPSNLLLSDLHKIIQTSMGWQNSHMHQFIKDGEYYAANSDYVDMGDDDFSVDYKKIKISDLLTKVKEKMIYEYDFGDGWEHDVLLEKILPVDKKINYPICTDGKMNCPPEDCGGVWGYADMLKILKQPKHKEYEEFVEWLGDEFDPEYFDKDEVNEFLQSEDFGCVSFF